MKSDQFEKFHVLQGLLSKELCAIACSYIRLKAEIGEMHLGDSHVPNSYTSYGDLLMEVLLEHLRSRAEEVTHLSLLPTHSYVRIYRSGDQLSSHKDRAACEVTMSVTLGCESSELWPIFLQTSGGTERVELRPGDGLIYPGYSFEHWREPFNGVWQAQLTLHYVNRFGPNAAWQFDKRPGLGRHRGTRRV